MTTESATIVQRLWNHCNVLRDLGGAELDNHYCAIPIELGKGSGKNKRKSEKPQQLEMF
jgi:hypothetical protein